MSPCLGAAIEDQTLPLILPDRLKVAAWCYREAAEVHTHPEGMRKLFGCLDTGRGVTEDPAQAIVWLERAVDLGDAAAKSALGSHLMLGDARAGVVKDAARGFEPLREAVDEGYGLALIQFAACYMTGDGVEQDSAHGATLLLKYVTQGAHEAGMVMAESALAECYMEGNGVEADTVQAALWCQRAADGGDAWAIANLPIIRMCNFCSSTPAHKHCERCRKVRYCNTTCQAAHWNRETDPHKGHCFRAAEASEQEVGGASTSAQ